ncbi:flavodoxin family protein [Mycobacterium sp. KBS0706]|uniref:flavodoxin family protein n=1 Tax=Mycobacterium sp. KBS0706 TaxID=2578109 RepID=UPI00110F6B76|nr:NAD(P)H-dependent oxidoreductase [Mycobacterium sp. KBS0706]TSD82882.1 flavodoxin family protein [Mycobacterium sp. KBS0706]
MPLKAIAFNCTLKSTANSSEPSSTDRLLTEVLAALAEHEVSGEIIRAADHDIKPGVTSDEGPGDAWPALRRKILAADILLIGTPIWLGQRSSICKRVLERMDAFLEETDDEGRMISFGSVAAVAVVGFTIPAGAVTYWVGEAMGNTNYIDLAETPEAVQKATATLARNTAHLARLLSKRQYPGGD